MKKGLTELVFIIDKSGSMTVLTLRRSARLPRKNIRLADRPHFLMQSVVRFIKLVTRRSTLPRITALKK